MKRRDVLSAGALGGLAFATTGQTVAADDHTQTGVLLVHGSWHGSWCWDLVEKPLNEAGMITLGIDLPGDGLNTTIPKSFQQRPLDPAAFASEPSAHSGIAIDTYADAVIAGADRLIAMGATQVVAVGHSMGGVPVTFGAAKAPSKFAGLIYLTALAPTPDKPAGAYLGLEEQAAKSQVPGLALADPAKVGALRVDPRSTDPEYMAKFKEALAADVPDAQLGAIMHLLTPDAPIAMYGEVANFAPGFGQLKQTFIRCRHDKAVLPSTVDAIAADMAAAFPDAAQSVVELDSAHEAMFSVPQAVAKAIIAAV